MPKVSVLMPVYKTQEKHLREAIESILNQTFRDFEFLILDDCPDDDREDIVKSYQDERIKYSKNEQNLGITLSRNKLIDMAKGEYLAVFDHDDISLPDRLEQEVKYLDNHPEVGVVGCVVKKMSNQKTSQNPTEDHEIKLALMHSCAITHSASMIRKSVLSANNIKYEGIYSPSEDYALWCRLIPYTNFYNLDEVLLIYRDHQDNTSHRQAQKMINSAYGIWGFVKTDNPALYAEFLLRAKTTHRIKLLGFIPFLTISKQGRQTGVYLFEKIKLLSIKSSTKLKAGM